MTKLQTLANKVEKARVKAQAARSAYEALEKEYEALCKETEEKVEQSCKGRYSRTLMYKGKTVKVEKLVHSWVIVRTDKKRDHYDSLRQIRLGIVSGAIAI